MLKVCCFTGSSLANDMEEVDFVLYVVLELRQLNWLTIGQLRCTVGNKRHAQADRRRPNVSKRGKAER